MAIGSQPPSEPKSGLTGDEAGISQGLPLRLMNVNRVTLSALGTTGVLLAASLTMLGLVSALVTFDAWPTQGGQASASQIAVRPAPTPPVVRAVRHTGPTASVLAARRGAGAAGDGAGRGGVRLASGALASRAGSTGGGLSGGGGAGSARFVSAPSPQVSQSPPGEGGGGGIHRQQGPAAPPVIHQVTCTATSTVSGVAGGVVNSC